MLTLQNGTCEDAAVYLAIQHPEPQTFPENTSTKRDRMIFARFAHAPSMAARDLHVASDPELCGVYTGAADYTPIVGHGKGSWTQLPAS